MLTIKVSFPWGRYYAHPWGQNPVRISEAEWPPSPWRLLRTLAAAWFRRHPEESPSDDFCAVLKPLGQNLPMIKLGKVSFGNTVHYHPNSGVPSDKVRHENHFAATDREVAFHWQLEADEESRIHRQLADLATDIHYFGRAESVAELSVEQTNATIDTSTCARVVVNDGQPGRRIDADCRDVFCPNPNDFEARDLWSCRNAEREPLLAPAHLVQDLFDRSQPLPDGAKWFSFQMPDGWPQKHVVRFPKPPKRKPMSKHIIAKYLEFSLQCRIPIPVKHTVSIAELFRDRANRLHRGDSFALTGHRSDTADVANNHQHAFYLPQPVEAETQSLSRLIVWCKHGFTQPEVNALMSVETLRWADARFPARPILVQLQGELPQTTASRSWQSLTRFVPPRHWYRKKFEEGRVRDGYSPEEQMVRCLHDAGIDVACEVTRFEPNTNRAWDVCKVHLPAAEKKKSKYKRSHNQIGLLLSLEFEEPVALNVPSFGHSSHFGLGQFVPVSTPKS